MSDDILCIGEILWDALPDGLFLGGAPFNVAYHLHALGTEVAVASRVGDDLLGEEALRRLRAYGLATDLIQIDDSRPTGFVRVELDASGEPAYEIVAPAAWDAITLTDALRRRAHRAPALVYGSLAQRAVPSRQTIQELIQADALSVFDINLRPPYVDRAVVDRSLRAADVVKCNAEEFERLNTWFDLSDEPTALAGLAAAFGCEAVCVTRGAAGAWLWREGEQCAHPGYDVTVADTVGAGDAFLAGLLTGLLAGEESEHLLDRANRLGAYVASRDGALPAYSVGSRSDVADLPLPLRNDPASS
ncbi:MAG: carbohydrate kinase family protein [Salinivenus sp.]